MPRRPRVCLPGIPVHVVQRGNNRQVCFASDADLAAYANWLAEGSAKYGLEIHGWVFMTNHVHLLLTLATEEGVSRFMQFIGRLYVRYFNEVYGRSGTLFEGRYRSSLVHDREYLLSCLQYIELNPVRAGMVRDPGDYPWSSYRAHAFGLEVKMWTPHPLYLELGENPSACQANYRQLVGQTLDSEVIARIRHCLNKGLVLGSERFRDEVRSLNGESQ